MDDPVCAVEEIVSMPDRVETPSSIGLMMSASTASGVAPG